MEAKRTEPQPATGNAVGGVCLPVWALLLCLLASGCKSVSWSGYASPRVIGAVVDMNTGNPLRHVRVRRVTAEERGRTMEPAKGGQQLQERSVYTGREGRFDLPGARVLGPFGDSLWWKVTLSFEHSGYEPFSAQYAFAVATNAVNGEPVVDTGEVRLIRRR